MGYNDDKPQHDILQETKKLAEELLHKPEYAGRAIHDRNIIIRGLKADIEHRRIAFKEIASRYEELSNVNDQLVKDKVDITEQYNTSAHQYANLQSQYQAQSAVLVKCQQDLAVQQSLTEGSWAFKLEKLAQSLTGWKGWVFKVILSRPFSRYFVLVLFILLVVASITGWEPVFKALSPIIKLFK